jgi:hypothetical protein
MIGEAAQSAASARVIADLEGRVLVAVHGTGAAANLHCGIADVDRFDPALGALRPQECRQTVSGKNQTK